MAYRGYKVVVFTPSGRERVQSILLDNLTRHRNIIDEYQVWLNTDDKQVDDTKWLKSLPESYDWVRVIERPEVKFDMSGRPKQFWTGLFYPNTLEEDTIYIRMDDDIVYIDDDFFTNMLDFRIDNPQYFLVMANIWNNAIISYIHQQLGNIPSEPVVKSPFCMDEVAWRSGTFAEKLHRILLDKIETGSTHELYFDRADLLNAARFSISCFSFFGKDFKKFDGVVGFRDGELLYDEEVWLTEIYPIMENQLNTICGSALVSHYSFFSQRGYLDGTDILETYRTIGRRNLSDSYYDLLGGEVVKPELKDLVVFNLPPSGEGESPVISSLKAQKDGYSYALLGSSTHIYKDGKKVGEIIGKPNGLKIDRMLANLWKKS